MEQSLHLEQRLAATPQVILASTLLQLSSAELEEAIARELAENPLLERVEPRRCPWCGGPLRDGYCALCSDARPGVSVDPFPARLASPLAGEKDPDLAWVASTTSLAEHVLDQARLVLPARDVPVVVCLLDHVDERGWLCCKVPELAALCQVDPAQVERVLAVVQRLDPVGIAARDPRECLLVQLEHLGRQGVVNSLATVLVDEHWQALGRQSLADVARRAGASVVDVQAALRFIRHNLNPFPAHAYWGDRHRSPLSEAVVYPRPDVVIIRCPAPRSGYEVDLPGARASELRMCRSCLEAVDRAGGARDAGTEWAALCDRARLFIRSVEQRWLTLRRVAEYLVDYQRDFLDGGERFIKPLTRARVAEAIEVHESTVSRAVASKYARLPEGRIIPLSVFFDDAAPIKALIKDLVAQETEPLSDRQIVDLLAERGCAVARRTVTKYRNELGLLSSALRRRQREFLID